MKIFYIIISILGVIICLEFFLNLASLFYDPYASLPSKEQSGSLQSSSIGSNSEPSVKIIPEGKPIDIADVSPTQLKTEEYGDIFFYDGQIKRRVTYHNNPISQLSFSSIADKFAYFVDYSYDPTVDYHRETVLYIENMQNRKPKEVFSGSFKVSGWEWFSDNEILVSEGCGTECQAEFLVDLKSDKKYVLQYGVGYTWSPDKNWVFAYNYSYRTGITIGDKFGNVIYRYHILPPESETVNTPLAMWSPDSSKLALVMKKSDDKSFELLVFDSRKKFKKIFQSDVMDAEEFELKWTPDGKSVEVNNKSYHF